MLDDSGCMVGNPETMPLGQLAEPGHAPTQEASPLAEGKVAAREPTSARICWAESAPNPGACNLQQLQGYTLRR